LATKISNYIFLVHGSLILSGSANSGNVGYLGSIEKIVDGIGNANVNFNAIWYIGDSWTPGRI